MSNPYTKAFSEVYATRATHFRIRVVEGGIHLDFKDEFTTTFVSKTIQLFFKKFKEYGGEPGQYVVKLFTGDQLFSRHFVNLHQEDKVAPNAAAALAAAQGNDEHLKDVVDVRQQVPEELISDLSYEEHEITGMRIERVG